MPLAQPLDREPQRRCGANQQDDRDDAAATARGVAARLAIELAIEERNGAAGKHDRMSDAAEDRRHVAVHRIDGEPGDEQQQRVDAGRRHGAVSFAEG